MLAIAAHTYIGVCLRGGWVGGHKGYSECSVTVEDQFQAYSCYNLDVMHDQKQKLGLIVKWPSLLGLIISMRTHDVREVRWQGCI